MRKLPRTNVSHFGHVPKGSGRVVSMNVGQNIGGLAEASDQELTDTMIKYLKEAGKPIVLACAQKAAKFSRRIPNSLKIRVDETAVHILGGGPTAPNAYPFDPPSDPPVRHPVWGHGPRDKWHWAVQPYRPFLEEGADEAGDRAAEAFANILDEWAKEIGTDRP